MTREEQIQGIIDGLNSGDITTTMKKYAFAVQMDYIPMSHMEPPFDIIELEKVNGKWQLSE